MTPEELREELDAGRFRPAYLLLGEEPLLRDDALAAIRSATLVEGASDFNWDLLPAASTTPARLRDAVAMLPVMAPRRLVCLPSLADRRAASRAPADALAEELEKYKHCDLVWCQEEPRNMGAWTFVESFIEDIAESVGVKSPRPRYAGRPSAASPATGLASRHAREQSELIEDALTTGKPRMSRIAYRKAREAALYERNRDVVVGDHFFLGALVSAALWRFASLKAVESYALGVAFGGAYLYLLARYVGSIGEATLDGAKEGGIGQARFAIVGLLVAIAGKNRDYVDFIPLLVGFFSLWFLFYPLPAGSSCCTPQLSG